MNSSGRFVLLLAALVAMTGCSRAGEDPGATLAALFSGAGAEWVDMTYDYDESTIFWPTAQPFELEVVSAGMAEGGYYYAANRFRASEHGGTHLDAPRHFAEGRWTVGTPCGTPLAPGPRRVPEACTIHTHR